MAGVENLAKAEDVDRLLKELDELEQLGDDFYTSMYVVLVGGCEGVRAECPTQLSKVRARLCSRETPGDIFMTESPHNACSWDSVSVRSPLASALFPVAPKQFGKQSLCRACT